MRKNTVKRRKVENTTDSFLSKYDNVASKIQSGNQEDDDSSLEEYDSNLNSIVV
jgi:hypothetical protein